MKRRKINGFVLILFADRQQWIVGCPSWASPWYMEPWLTSYLQISSRNYANSSGFTRVTIFFFFFLWNFWFWKPVIFCGNLLWVFVHFIRLWSGSGFIGIFNARVIALGGIWNGKMWAFQGIMGSHTIFFQFVDFFNVRIFERFFGIFLGSVFG